ncbi:MAG: DUF2889 domain-containing protein [Acidimicrobiales bacterium]
MGHATGEQVEEDSGESHGTYGVRDPLSEVPSFTHSTIRRTMHVDVGPANEWFGGGELQIDGSARDVRGLAVAAEGSFETLAAASVSARFDRKRVLDHLETDPVSPWADAMVGERAGGGFRRKLAELSPGSGATLVRQLMEDLPAAALISGYASLRLARRLAVNPGDLTPPGVLDRMTDMCSGWRAGGVAVNNIAAGHGVPFQDCPEAPDLTGDDPDSWHAIPPLGADCMRRRRLVDVVLDDDARAASLWAMFRDTVGEADGSELVLHEYALTGRLERTDRGMALVSVEADPKVLPFGECPAAASEVRALTGKLLGDLPAAVPVVLFGVASCTHLNDLLRNVGGMAGLLENALFA